MGKKMYIEKQSGCSYNTNNHIENISVFQPTPEGVNLLCEYYSSKYAISLEIFEVEPVTLNQDQASFKQFSRSDVLQKINEGEKRGFILSNQQYHAIPVLVSKQNKVLNVYIFDSTSGVHIESFYEIAELFPDSNVYLNRGTRQADKLSCITDAICILKDALRIANLEQLINSKIIEYSVTFNRSSRLKRPSTLRPNNFFVFKMPEPLLKTAQRSDYLRQAEADFNAAVQSKKHPTLKEFHAAYSKKSLINNELRIINSYLFFKSKRHQEILDSVNIITRHFQVPFDFQTSSK